MNHIIITPYIVYSYQQNKKKGCNFDKINQPKISNNATNGDIFPPIKSKIESLDAFIDDLIRGQETTQNNFFYRFTVFFETRV